MFHKSLQISGSTWAAKGWGQSVKLRTLILNSCSSECSPSSSSCGYGLCQLLAAPAARTPCLLQVLSPDCLFPPFYQLGHVFPSTSKLSHASHFDCFPWFCELSPSCLHLLANRLPRMFPLVASLGPLTVPSMALDPYPERARACPTPYMLSVIPPYTCTTSS